MIEDPSAPGDDDFDALAEARWLELNSGRRRSPTQTQMARWMTLGVAATAFALVLTFAEFASLDRALEIALFSFVVAIPFGLGSWLIESMELAPRVVEDVVILMATVAVGAWLVGFAFYLAHFNQNAAWVFVVVAFATCTVFVWSLDAWAHKRKEISVLREQAVAGDPSAVSRIVWPHRDFGVPEDVVAVHYPTSSRWSVEFDGIGFDLAFDRDGRARYVLDSEHRRHPLRYWIRGTCAPRRSATSWEELASILDGVKDQRTRRIVPRGSRVPRE